VSIAAAVRAQQGQHIRANGLELFVDLVTQMIDAGKRVAESGPVFRLERSEEAGDLLREKVARPRH
jgi:hypothetical protein